MLRADEQEQDDTEDGGETEEEDEDGDVVYLVEGCQIGYGDKRAWTTCF
jgi:hypothetical protein